MSTNTIRAGTLEKTYIVRFASVTVQAGALQIAVSEWASAEPHKIIARTLPELETQLLALAARERRTVSPSILMLERSSRKPMGFDALCRRLRVIHYAEPAHAQRAG